MTLKDVFNLINSWWGLSIIKLNQKFEPLLNESFISNEDLVAITLKNPFFSENLQSFLKEKEIAPSEKNVFFWSFLGIDVFLLKGSDFYFLSLGDFSGQKQESTIKEKLLYNKFSPLEVDNFLQQLRFLEKSEHKKIKSLFDLVFTKQVVAPSFTEKNNYDGIIGSSPAITSLFSFLDKIKSRETTILIEGESGTGKELIAKSIHKNSPRSSKSFITINCSALNDNLLESELFGHRQGSFTGATNDKLGLFESAHQGTLFLDEVGDTSLSMQVKLLRVLQDGSFIPVGGTHAKTVDVRIIAATNKNLRNLVEEGLFREDLFYRLNVINLKTPTLKERSEDISLLASYFLRESSKSLSQEALQKMLAYSWPGNIRELENEIKKLIAISGDNSVISASLLKSEISDPKNSVSFYNNVEDINLKKAIESLEKTLILEALKKCRWNKSHAAKKLHISRASLISKTKLYKLTKQAS